MANSQVVNGKAFEYCVAKALAAALGVQIEGGEELGKSQSCFEKVSPEAQGDFIVAARLAVDHILEKEKIKLSVSVPEWVWLAKDAMGKKGDVRDVIVTFRGGSEIGISCKNNHDAFKHPRLSATSDFVKKWGLDQAGCSDEYWSAVRPVFAELKEIKRASGNTTLWSELQDVPSRFYWKVLDAFEKEILRLTAPGAPTAPEVSKRLIAYTIGNQDFYKVICRAEQVEIQGFNLNGTLAVSKTRYPEHVIGIDRLDGGQFSKTVRFNRGFTFNFRIHSAGSRVEPSLKFDVRAISLPPSEVYTNHITVPRA